MSILFNTKVTNLLNELVDNRYSLNIETKGDYVHPEGLTILATSFNNKIYKIVLVNGMNKHAEENKIVLMQLLAVTDKENLIQQLRITNSKKINVNIKHKFSNMITLQYEVLEEKEEEEEISWNDEAIEVGKVDLIDSKEILNIISNNFAEYEMYI
jgi:hypothetical protein